MLIDWKYTYKRRKWSVSIIIGMLQEKTWDAFQEFHSDRGISSPSESEFNSVLKETKKPVKVDPPKQPAKKKRTYTRKKRSSNVKSKTEK